ncbi:PREDICTED: high mobility group B protein 9-like [Nelumbo nucifera]|uniref:High mobility group B protein 9-like n=2 Tax=Nelumbo nucifera TaxID=4432 RepID=A0A1U8ASL4_NELNU|nr:PREDICTED: high mobility group B protein 9-like [Nelumbo nucifera]XP_010266073.1 PREDICTED: high mobility group B protein 9-like [Nelumbo nucifera]DAD41738.1 TPA_asm: hypothetical protein HUJ06_016061 [Nelumbo nucifera]
MSSEPEEEKIAIMTQVNVVEDKGYPSPLSSHEDVVKNPTVFWDTLRQFHSNLGTKFMVPVIGGKELDLHLLYVEVTKRGGFQQVVREKKWRDVSAAFNFSPTTTSASFVLRKHYSSLLHFYEQVYFFKLPEALPVMSPPCKSEMPHPMESGSESMQQQQEQTSQKTTTNSPDLNIREHSYLPVVGTIDGKFDYGYLVSVKLGSDILHGILYHPPSTAPSSSISPINAGISCESTPRLSGKKKRRRKHGDPSHPKPNRSGYNFFFAEKHSMLKALYPSKEREFTKMIGESWFKLSEEERMVYQNIGLKDKERYRRELKEYKERLSLKQLQAAEVETADPRGKSQDEN